MRVLFVCGFNATLCEWSASYDALRAHLAEVGLEVEYFTYTWAECAESVYARLRGALLSGGRFEALVAYSMGATLVARYFTCHADAVAAYRRVVLCMPLLAPNATHAMLARAPLSSLVPLPLAPHGALCSMQQVVHVYRHWLDNDNTEKVDAVALLERPNVHVLYALRETLTPVPWRVLSRAANLHVVHGGHAAFETPAYAAQFFAALDEALGV